MIVLLRSAFRSVARAPSFSLVTLLVLALGIGATTAIFSVVHTVLLAPLAYHDGDRLVQIQSRHAEQGVSVLAPAAFVDLARDARAFSVLAAQRYDYVNLTKTASPTVLTGVQATDAYFRLFGVAPLLGRTWNPDETRSGGPPVVVLGEALWRAQFGGRDTLVGETIVLDDTAHTVIGIMPASFGDPWGSGQLWRPIPMDGSEATVRNSRFWGAFGRLAAGASLEQGNTELGLLARRMELAHDQDHRGWTLEALDLRAILVGNYRQGLWVLLGAVGCLLLITCANVAGLSVVRALARQKELAVRAAVGASAGQLLRLLLAESLLLAVAGGLLGLLCAHWGISAIITAVGSGWLPRSSEIAIHAPVLVASLLLTLATGFAFGLAPALAASRTQPNDVLKDHSGRGSAGPGARRIRSALVVAEIALAVVLLVGTGLLARSFVGLMQRDPGVRTESVLSVGLALSAKRYDTNEKSRAYYERIEETVRALPGVASVGFTQTVPFTWGIPATFIPIGPSAIDERSAPSVFYDSVSLSYFSTLGIPLLKGRLFAASDHAGAPPVAVLSEATARRLFGTDDPIGRILRPADPASKLRVEVIGVVADVRRTGLASKELPLQMYRSLTQRPTAFATLMIQSRIGPEPLAQAVQKAIWSLDPDQPISRVTSVDRLLANTVLQPRLYLLLFTLFAGLAVTLAAIGLYGLIAYGILQRTREFGIRTALGATRRELLALVLGEGGRLAFVGVGLGLLVAWWGAGLMEEMIYDVPSRDPLVFVGVAALLGAVSLVACYLPARRILGLQAVDALRAD